MPKDSFHDEPLALLPLLKTGYFLPMPVRSARSHPWRISEHKTDIQVRRADLGLFLISFSLLLLCNPNVKVSAVEFNAITAGGVAGFLAGLIGTGAIRGLALAAFDLEKSAFVATSAGIDSGVDISRMSIYLRNGYLAPNSVAYIVGLLLIAFAGSYLGVRLIKSIFVELCSSAC